MTDPLAKRAERCFEQSAAPLLAALALVAQQTGFTAVGIRDAAANSHKEVLAKKDDLGNPYSLAVIHYQHYFFADTPYKERPDSPYTLIPLPERDGDLLRPKK